MRWLSLVLALGACAEDRVFVAYPEALASNTKLLVRRSPLSVEVIEGSPRIELNVSDDVVELFLLTYEQTAASMRLTPGPLDLDSPCQSCQLLEPNRVLHSLDASEFTVLEERPEWLFERLVPDAALRCGSCPVNLRSELLVTDYVGLNRHFFLRRWTTDSALFVGADSGVLARLTSTGAFELLCQPDPAFAGAVWAMLSEDGELWMVNAMGTLSSVQLADVQTDQPCGEGRRLRSPALGLSVTRLAGPPDQTTPDLFVLAVEPTLEAGLYRFHEDTWTRLTTLPAPASEPSMVHAADGWTYAVVGGDRLARARGAEVEVQQLVSTAVPRELTAVGDVPRFGIVVGDRYDGLLGRGASGDFEPLGNLPISERDGDRLRGIVGLGDGVLYATSRGEVRYFSPAKGYCPAQKSLFGRESGWNLLALPGPVVFSGTNNLYRAMPASTCPP